VTSPYKKHQLHSQIETYAYGEFQPNTRSRGFKLNIYSIISLAEGSGRNVLTAYYTLLHEYNGLKHKSAYPPSCDPCIGQPDLFISVLKGRSGPLGYSNPHIMRCVASILRDWDTHFPPLFNISARSSLLHPSISSSGLERG
jgi:hypothetical protein